MKLENFNISSNYILVAIKQHSKIGTVEMLTPVTDKFTEIVKMGPLCEKYKVGQLVMLDDLQYLSMPFFVKGESKPVKCVLAREVNIIGDYTPDEEEKIIMLANGPERDTSNDIRELNIIDNPGIDQGEYLKEEETNSQLYK